MLGQKGFSGPSKGPSLGPHGAIECFEKSWDLEEEHLNPMAWLALHRIHSFMDNREEAEHWGKRLAESGGEDAVANEWIEVIENSITKLSPSFRRRMIFSANKQSLNQNGVSFNRLHAYVIP